ncbi:S8 family serine peptidase [bacterium LRH843]|nr:S8 family serine peptidase [bacterium LRH843]
MKKFMRTVSAIVLSSVVASTAFVQSGMASTSFQEQQQEGLNQIYERLELRPGGEKYSAQMLQKEENKISKDTLLVRYSTPLTAQEHKGAGATLQKRISTLGYDVVKIQGNAKLEDVVKRYANMDQVRSVMPSIPVQLFGEGDPKRAGMYHLDALNVEKAWELAGDHEVVVGVVDTGVDRNHPELKNQLIGEYNSFDPMKRPLPDLHGTHVSGIIAAEKGNGIGGYGVNPNAKILSIDVFNRAYGFDYDIAEGILYAVDQKVDVINLSLGMYYPSPVLKDAVAKAIEEGIVVVAAAGNENTDEMKPYPAAFPGVISVGATNAEGKRASFSNYGAMIDVVAPGEDVYAPAFDIDKHSTFQPLSGTSMSSPVVAGVVSLLLSKHPDLTPYEVKYILEKTAKDIGAQGYDLVYGYGMVDPVAALKFDVSKIPAKPANATQSVALNVDEEVTVSGTFDVLEKEYHYTVDVEEGDLIQFVLAGKEQYDLSFTIKENSAGSDTDPIEVDEAPAGVIEARLYEAKQAGTITVIVKDANGKYSETGRSTFNLSATKTKEFKDSGLSKIQPKKIQALPYSSEVSGDGPFYLAGEEGVRNYFRYTSKEGEMAQVDVSGIPGVEVGIRVYIAEEFDMFADMELEEEDFAPYPMYSDEMVGVGKDKTLTFETFPEMEYVIEVTSLPLFFNDPLMELLMMLFGIQEEVKEPQYSSHLPYTIEIKGEVLPPDEDMYPMMGGFEYMTEETVFDEELIESYHKQQEVRKASLLDMLLGGLGGLIDEKAVEELESTARPLSPAKSLSGYFQSGYDQDVFSFVPETNALFELSWNGTTTLEPVVDVLRIDQDKESGKKYVTPIANSGMVGMYESGNSSSPTNVYVGLEKGETYIFVIANQFGYGQASLDPYELELNVLKENVQDSYWKNNDYDVAKPVPNYTINGNMAMTGNPTMFYYKGGKDELVGLHFESLEATASEKQGLPDKLFGQILPIALVAEDSDGDGTLSERERENVTPFLPMYVTDTELRGSFRAKKDAGYFVIITHDPFYNGVQTSLAPYQLTVAEIDGSRADGSSLYARGSGVWGASGFLPVAAETGKTETKHTFSVQAAGTYDMTVTLPTDLDGVLAVYDQGGKEVAKVDHYGKGDSEVLSLTLEKGTYTIGVQDANGNTSLHAYQLILKKR